MIACVSVVQRGGRGGNEKGRLKCRLTKRLHQNAGKKVKTARDHTREMTIEFVHLDRK